MADTQLYQVTTTRGETFRWSGSSESLQAADGQNTLYVLGFAYLRCVGGELVALAHVESFVPID